MNVKHCRLDELKLCDADIIFNLYVSCICYVSIAALLKSTICVSTQREATAVIQTRTNSRLFQFFRYDFEVRTSSLVIVKYINDAGLRFVVEKVILIKLVITQAIHRDDPIKKAYFFIPAWV